MTARKARTLVGAHPNTELCLAACVAYIIRTHAPDAPINIEMIARRLGGLTSSKKARNDRDIGIKVDVEKICRVIRSSIGAAKVKYALANTLEEWDFQDSISLWLKQKAWLIATLSAGYLFGHDRIQLGHAIVVEYVKDSLVGIYDPGPETEGRRELKVDMLYSACRARGGGIIVIHPEPPTNHRASS